MKAHRAMWGVHDIIIEKGIDYPDWTFSGYQRVQTFDTTYVLYRLWDEDEKRTVDEDEFEEMVSRGLVKDYAINDGLQLGDYLLIGLGAVIGIGFPITAMIVYF